MDHPSIERHIIMTGPLRITANMIPTHWQLNRNFELLKELCVAPEHMQRYEKYQLLQITLVINTQRKRRLGRHK